MTTKVHDCSFPQKAEGQKTKKETNQFSAFSADHERIHGRNFPQKAEGKKTKKRNEPFCFQR